jgi:hypothetical protein
VVLEKKLRHDMPFQFSNQYVICAVNIMQMMKHLVAIDDETISGSPNGKWNMYKHKNFKFHFL